MKTLFIFCFILTITISADAQIFGGIMNEAKRKIERKVEDKIIQAVSDELAQRAFKPIDQAIDSMMRKKYQDSLGNGQPYNNEKTAEAYASFLSSLNAAVDLPEKYTFDVTQEVETIDYSKKRNYIKLHYSKNSGIIGMETTDEKQIKQLVVMDLTKDIMILYTTDKKGKKTGQAIPSVMKLAGAMSNAVKPSIDSSAYNMNLKKTGKSKKIAGYISSEYKGSSAEEEIVMYISDQFPIKWDKNFTRYTSQFAPDPFTENISTSDGGVMLEYENSRKDEKGEKSTWSTKKISEKTFSVITSEYEFKKTEN